MQAWWKYGMRSALKMCRRANTGSHANRRFKKRFGRSFTQRLRERIIHMICSDQAVFLRRSSGQRVWLVNLDNQIIKVVMTNYQPHRIITCIKPTDKEIKKFSINTSIRKYEEEQ